MSDLIFNRVFFIRDVIFALGLLWIVPHYAMRFIICMAIPYCTGAVTYCIRRWKGYDKKPMA